MSKQIVIGGVSYDSRTIVTGIEKLNLPNHPTVTAFASPQMDKSIKVDVKIAFGRFQVKEFKIISQSPRRIDAIKMVEDALHQTVMYRSQKGKAA